MLTSVGSAHVAYTPASGTVESGIQVSRARLWALAFRREADLQPFLLEALPCVFDLRAPKGKGQRMQRINARVRARH